MSNMVINTNIASLDSHRNMKKVGAAQFQAAARLSSGLRVNSAADDAAGLAISEKMRAQIRSLDMASRNSQDAISLVQTAEGGLQEINNMVIRIRELTVQVANDTNVTLDRQKIGKEMDQLVQEISATANRVEFNTRTLLNGDITSLHMQIGANNGQSLGVSIDDVITAVAQPLSVACLTAEAGGATASSFLCNIDQVLSFVTDERAQLGAWQNRLEYTIKSLDISSQNLAASESRIRDADMGKEMMQLTQAQVLQQAATAMLAQNNQNPQMVLQLLR